MPVDSEDTPPGLASQLAAELNRPDDSDAGGPADITSIEPRPGSPDADTVPVPVPIAPPKPLPKKATPGPIPAASESDTIVEAGLTPAAGTPRPATATPAPSGPHLAPGTKLGRFEILDELGRGGMGVVYRAFDQDLKREVALKLLSVELSRDARELERFRREATLASKLRHPRIVGVYSFGEVEGRPFFTMPLVDGRSLKDELQAKGRFEPRRAARILEQTARAIDAAHQQRVVHRDLKPANVLLDQDDAPLILDFGLAKDLGHGPELTRSGEVLGTPCYMSPEQARGEVTHADHRVDVYALGAILYELLTGRLPYDGLTANEVIQKIIASDPRPPRHHVSDVPYELETICLKAMTREPWLRYQTADAMADDLDRFLEGAPIVARRPGWVAEVVRFARAHRAAVAMLVVLLVTVALGIGLFRRSTGRVAALAASERALELLRAAGIAERRGDFEAAARGFDRAFVVAEEAYANLPSEKQVFERFVEVGRVRALYAERQQNWPLAESLRERVHRLTGDPADEKALRQARGLAEVRVAGLGEDDVVDFFAWDRSIGAVDTSQRAQAKPGALEARLRAGSWLVVLRRGGKAPPAGSEADDRAPRWLLALARGQEAEVVVADPGPPPDPGMVFVPGADLVVGREGADPDEAPRLARAGPFWIDRTEVTVAQYREFLAHVAAEGHGGCGMGCPGGDHRPPDFADRPASPAGEARPVTNVTWWDARAYAAWRGKRLPTEVEWEHAAGAVDQRLFPWGDRWEPWRANVQRDDMAPVLDYPGDESPYGVVGLAGNADEWCQDEVDLPGEPGARRGRVLRGGARWDVTGEAGRIHDRGLAVADDRFKDTGFRCVSDAVAAPARIGRVPLGVPAPRPPARARPTGAEVVLRVAGWPHYADPRFADAFRRRYLEQTGVAVVVTQTATIASNDELLPLLERGEADLVTPSCDYARTIIDSGRVQPLDAVGREGELLPGFRRPPFLQRAGQTFGACYAYGPMWLVSVDPGVAPGRWRDLWDPALAGRTSVWDDGVRAVTLAATDLGLPSPWDLGDAELARVEEHLVALLKNGCRPWRSPEEAVHLVQQEGVVLLEDWGIIARNLEREGRRVQREIPAGGSAVWIDAWMVAATVSGPRLDAARAWIEYALSPENQRDLLVLAGYDPVNARTVRLLDKRTAQLRVHALRERLERLQRWREVPRRDRYLQVWARAKERAAK